MRQRIEHTLVSVILGVLAAGLVSAALAAALPPPWRGRVVVVVSAAVVAATVRARRFRPPER